MTVPATDITTIDMETSFQCFNNIGDGDIVLDLKNTSSNVHTTLDS